MRLAETIVDPTLTVGLAATLVISQVWLLRSRALLARACGDENRYRDHWDRYRDAATSLGFEGHIAWAEEMS